MPHSLHLPEIRRLDDDDDEYWGGPRETSAPLAVATRSKEWNADFWKGYATGLSIGFAMAVACLWR